MARRLVAAGGLAVAFAVLSAADPVAAAPAGPTLTAVCGGNTVVMPLPGESQFPPGFVVGTHQVFIPYKYKYSVGAVVAELKSRHRRFEGEAQKPGPVPADATTCSFTSFTENGQTFEATGSLTGVIRGQ